jgi:hypothetical protein
MAHAIPPHPASPAAPGGHDIEPGANQRTDYGMKCRLNRTTTGLSGQPEEKWLQAALDRAGTGV